MDDDIYKNDFYILAAHGDSGDGTMGILGDNWHAYIDFRAPWFGLCTFVNYNIQTAYQRLLASYGPIGLLKLSSLLFIYILEFLNKGRVEVSIP